MLALHRLLIEISTVKLIVSRGLPSIYGTCDVRQGNSQAFMPQNCGFFSGARAAQMGSECLTPTRSEKLVKAIAAY